MVYAQEPHNSVCPKFCKQQEINRVGPPGMGKVERVDLSHEGGVGQTREKVIGFLISPEQHKKIYLGFCPDLRG